MKIFAVLALALAANLPTAAPAAPPPTRSPAKAAAKSVPPPAAGQSVDKPHAPEAATLAVAMHAGPQDEAISHYLLKPYSEAGGLPLASANWTGGNAGTPKAAVPDLVLLNGAQLEASCKAQLLDRLDWARLNRDRYQPEAVSDCGAGVYKETTVLAWDTEKLQDAPNWGDFWDVARHPGRRGLPRSARGTLEVALMADGVAANDVYRTLRSPVGQDRAFRKLDQLKPYIIWWDKAAEAGKMLEDGRVLLTAAPAASVLKLNAAKRHFSVQWNNSLAGWYSWAVPQGAPHKQASALALLVAEDLARQAAFTEATLEAPAARDALALLPADLQVQAPANRAVTMDDSFWAENGDKLEARFLVWLGK